MKGKSIIELTDVNTGKVETYEEENMITNALNDICGFFPQLMGYTSFNTHFGTMTENILGGIKLFDSPIEENPDSYYIPRLSQNKIIGYASSNTSSGIDSRRGSRNLLESIELDNGYKYVWDFSTAEANGTISSACLTSAEGGTKAWFPYREASFPRYGSASNWRAEMNLGEGYYVDIEYNSTTKIATVVKKTFNYDRMVLTENLFIEKEILRREVAIDIPVTAMLYFRDGGDGYWYAVYTAGSTSGNATVYIAKINKETFAYSYETLTLADVKVTATSIFNHRAYGGYLYLNKAITTSIGKGFYRISLSNPSEIKIIEFNEWREISVAYTHICPAFNGMMYSNGILFDGDGYEAFFDYCASIINGSNTYYYYYYGTIMNYGQACNVQYFTNKARTQVHQYYYNNSSYNWHSYPINIDKYVLMSINNLSSPVVKTADKTMKITYILTYE